jgi:hypothetical protein
VIANDPGTTARVQGSGFSSLKIWVVTYRSPCSMGRVGCVGQCRLTWAEGPVGLCRNEEGASQCYRKFKGEEPNLRVFYGV